MHSRLLSLWRWARERLRETDTWLILAVLSLAGWTTDALRMHLLMHPVFWVGLREFAGHFWYVVPMAIAIVALARFRPRPHLLGLALYDETGRLIQQQGDCGLGRLPANGALSAVRGTDHARLHGVTVPAGGAIYFLRQGGSTLVLHFSAPAAPEDLAAGVRQIHMQDALTAFDLFAGLEPATAALAVNVLDTPTKRRVLTFFAHNDLTTIELADLAFQVGGDGAVLADAVQELMAMGLVEPLCACDRTFYRLTRDPALLGHIRALAAWQKQWDVQVDRLKGALH